MVSEIGNSDFEQKVLKASGAVLVDFWAPWCGPCKMVAPVVDRLSVTYAGKMAFYKLNVDESPQLAAKYRVMSIPALLIFKGGQVADTVVGAVPERTLAARIDAAL